MPRRSLSGLALILVLAFSRAGAQTVDVGLVSEEATVSTSVTTGTTWEIEAQSMAVAASPVVIPDEELLGFLEPSEVVQVSSQVPGILDAVFVERGDTVVLGQELARLKSGLEANAVEFAKAKVEFARRKVERSKELFEKRLASMHEKDELQTEVDLSQIQVGEALEKLRIRSIQSSIAGVVLDRFNAPGDFVGEKPILKIAALDPLNLEVTAPLRFFGSVQKGRPAEVRPEDPVGGVYTASVVIVDPVIDPASGSFRVRLRLPNPGLRLPSGLKCKVRFR
jgi:RND family efflux transporter MFP subunit